MNFETKYSDFLTGKTTYIFENIDDAASFLNEFYRFIDVYDADIPHISREVIKYQKIGYSLGTDGKKLIAGSRPYTATLFTKSSVYLVELL